MERIDGFDLVAVADRVSQRLGAVTRVADAALRRVVPAYEAGAGCRGFTHFCFYECDCSGCLGTGHGCHKWARWSKYPGQCGGPYYVCSTGTCC